MDNIISSNALEASIEREPNIYMNSNINYPVTEVLNNIELTPEQLEKSIAAYSDFHNAVDQETKIGLFDEDLRNAFTDPSTILIRYSTDDEESLFAPLLVDANQYSWKKTEIVKSQIGIDNKIYVYAHPYLPKDENNLKIIKNVLSNILDKGDVILLDQYIDQDIIENSFPDNINVENFSNDGELNGKTDVYVGEVIFNDINCVKESDTIFEIYEAAIKSNEITRNNLNGPSLTNIIEGEEAQRIWELYEKPFNDLDNTHPEYAGFTKEQLLELLQNEDVVKVINRVEGKISTLCLFIQNFENEPWYNSTKFMRDYPEYYGSRNILLFPGIVTDPEMRGENYSLEVIDLATKMLAKRRTNILIAFECTEQSTLYIPQIVKAAVENSKVASVAGITNTDNPDQGTPVSTIVYKKIDKLYK